MSRRQAPLPTGFTLLELLVAMAIFAIIGALAMGGLNAVLAQDNLVKAQMARLGQVQRAVRLLSTDLANVQPRFVRDAIGDCCETPLVAGEVDSLVRLTRSGWSNPAGLPRGTLQRVQYRLEDEALIREYLPVLDPGSLVMEPRRETLLDNVREVRLYFFDPAGVQGGNPWLEQWPPLRDAGTGSGALPPAIRLVLDLPDWGEIERIIEIGQ